MHFVIHIIMYIL